MEAFGLTQRAHSTVEGVSVESFIFSTIPSYTLYRDVQLTQSTGWGLKTFPKHKSAMLRMSASCKSLSFFWLYYSFIHPAGFSPEHTISVAFRLLQDSPKEPFALWQLTDNDFQPKMGVVLDRKYRIVWINMGASEMIKTPKLAINENDPFSAVFHHTVTQTVYMHSNQTRELGMLQCPSPSLLIKCSASAALDNFWDRNSFAAFACCLW